MAQDDFEFDAVPKYMDFRNDENDGTLHDRSAFFHGDGPIHPTPHKPASLVNEPAKANKKMIPAVAEKEKIPVPAVLAEKNTLDEEQKKKLPGCTSNLALFNPGASRVKERARRRSQQIQVQEEVKPPTAAAPASKVVSTRRSVQKSPSRDLPFTRSREAAERNKQPLTRPQQVPAPRAVPEQKNLEEKKKQPVGSNSNLALFNRAASRLQEKARRRSQQIQVKEDPPKAAPKNVLRRPVPPTPPKNQAFSRSRDVEARVQASIERLSMPKNRQVIASPRSATGTPMKTAQPLLRRQNAGSTSSLPPNSDKPEAFKEKLRSYKPPSGKTPARALTVPQPPVFHRSRSQCRDVEAKPFKIDPKIRESVNRLSAPKKRESAAGLRRK